MASPLLSTIWHRVASLRPRPRSHIRLHRHVYRGQVWYLMQDMASGRTHRFSRAARVVIGLMNGVRTTDEIWTSANRQLGDDAPTQGELIELLGQLHTADLLQSDISPDIAELFARGDRQDRALKREAFANPMALRIRIWDPDRLLDRIAPVLRLIWGRWGAAVWLSVMLIALILLPSHWSELTGDFTDRMLAGENLLILYICFPMLKFLHEMGHATALKANGGEVHDLGLIVLVLLPVPYVEASAANVLASKYRRALIGAAGVAVELFIAALAFFLWLLVEPGIARAVLFNIMTIAGISTLFFNGNPLLRYDAYYILSDLAEIPNLGQRASRMWGHILMHHILGARESPRPTAHPGEAGWLLLYGAAAAIYRIIVTIMISLFIAGRFFIVGVAMAIWAIAAMAIWPALRVIWVVTRGPALRQHRFRAITTSIVLVGSCSAALLLIPFASGTTTEGIVWLPDEALVRAESNGVVEQVLVSPGAAVRRGEALIVSKNPLLAAELAISQARLKELEATHALEYVASPAKALLTRIQIPPVAAKLEMLQRRIDQLVTRAGSDGRLVLPQSDDLTGRFVKRGDLLGYVVTPASPLLRVIVPQEAIVRVRQATDRIQVRFVDRPNVVATGHIVRTRPDGETMLPSRALAVEGGGSITTDPRETKGPKALQRMFQFDLQLDQAELFSVFGQRVYVRFEHGHEPLAVQAYGAIRLLFLSRFSL